MSGRVALVTGGSRGIGLCIAKRLQSSGERVAITYKSSSPSDLGAGKDAESEPISAYRCDVTSMSDVEATFLAVEADLGPVEILICSAGINDDALLVRMSEERWASVIETNLTACYRVTKRAVPSMMRARSGRIILISSVVGLLGNAGQSNYAASKAGLIGFGRSLARELASRAVTVNVIAPGLIATDMLHSIGEERTKEFASRVPLGRLGTPEDVAAVVEFLASYDAAYVTGAIVPVDGGLGMGH